MNMADNEVIKFAYGRNANLYSDVLQVSPDATADEIQEAFFDRRYELYQLLSTGKSDDPNQSMESTMSASERRFTERRMDAVMAAFRILSDPFTRKEYDLRLIAAQNNQAGSTTNNAALPLDTSPEVSTIKAPTQHQVYNPADFMMTEEQEQVIIAGVRQQMLKGLESSPLSSRSKSVNSSNSGMTSKSLQNSAPSLPSSPQTLSILLAPPPPPPPTPPPRRRRNSVYSPASTPVAYRDEDSQARAATPSPTREQHGGDVTSGGVANGDIIIPEEEKKSDQKKKKKKHRRLPKGIVRVTNLAAKGVMISSKKELGSKEQIINSSTMDIVNNGGVSSRSPERSRAVVTPTEGGHISRDQVGNSETYHDNHRIDVDSPTHHVVQNPSSPTSTHKSRRSSPYESSPSRHVAVYNFNSKNDSSGRGPVNSSRNGGGRKKAITVASSTSGEISSDEETVTSSNVSVSTASYYSDNFSVSGAEESGTDLDSLDLLATRRRHRARRNSNDGEQMRRRYDDDLRKKRRSDHRKNQEHPSLSKSTSSIASQGTDKNHRHLTRSYEESITSMGQSFEVSTIANYDGDDECAVHQPNQTGGCLALIKFQITQNRIIKTVTDEITGSFHDTVSAVDQVWNAFTLKEEEINAVLGNIDVAKRTLRKEGRGKRRSRRIPRHLHFNNYHDDDTYATGGTS